MIKYYETKDDMIKTRPEDKTEGMVNNDSMHYVYNANMNQWIALSQVNNTNIPNVKDIEHTGTYQTNVNNTVPVLTSTDTEITNCKSTKLLCIDLQHPDAGEMYSFVDTYGSVIEPAVDGMKTNIDLNGNINGAMTLLGDTSISNYPFGGIGFDFINNRDAETADKVTMDMSSYTGIKFNYKASQIMKVKLMDKLSGDGSSWYAELPIATVATDITLSWSSFAQPSWISASQQRDITTSELVGVNIQYETQNTSMTFEFNSINMIGTGNLVPSGMNVVTTELNGVLFDKIDAWFDAFYVENDAQLLGKIMWLDDNQTDPDITVSEGIGYAMLLAVTMGNQIYKTKLDRLWQFYTQNENANGLMDWKVSGWNNVVVDSGAATDADLNVGLALIYAYELWHDEKYLIAARFVFGKVYANETYTSTAGKLLLMPGDSWNTYKNPSYINLPAIIMAKIYDTDNDWNTVYEDNLWLLETNQTPSTNYALPSNWCDESGIPVAGNTELGFGYDASRVLQHVYTAYTMNYDSRLKTYLSTIANDYTLRTRALGTTAIADTSVTITSSTWGSDNNSIGLGSIMLSYLVSSSVTEAEMSTMIEQILATDDDSDYYVGALKCINLAGCLQQLTRKAVCIDSQIECAFVTSLGDVGDVEQKVQSYYSNCGDVKYRLGNSCDWQETRDKKSTGSETITNIIDFSSNQTFYKVLTYDTSMVINNSTNGDIKTFLVIADSTDRQITFADVKWPNDTAITTISANTSSLFTFIVLNDNIYCTSVGGYS